MTRRPKLEPLAFAAVALALSFVPFVGTVLAWFETFFHEASHGVVALLTGARILDIQLAFNGSGLIRYSGSVFSPAVTFAGYPGAILCGALIYEIASRDHAASRGWALGLGGFVVAVTVIWGAGVETWVVAAVIAAGFVAIWWLPHVRATQMALQLVGAFLMVSGLDSAWDLLGASGRSDAMILREATFVPATVWVIIWVGLGALTLWRVCAAARQS